MDFKTQDFFNQFLSAHAAVFLTISTLVFLMIAMCNLLQSFLGAAVVMLGIPI
ncbi:MAG: hypothetical protein M3388_00370 [Acidobacteriota bacterium]|nr:hypothetical protein [Acidobacteriota bacterium]